MTALRTTQVKVEIYPFDDGKIDVSPYLVSCSVKRALTAGGGFTVGLVPKQDWADIIPTGSWVRIDLQCGPDMKMRTKLWGRVDEVTRRVQAGQAGSRQRIHYLTGRDHSGCLADAQVFFNPFLSLKAKSLGYDVPATPFLSAEFLDGLGHAIVDSFDGNPSAYMEMLYDIFFVQGVSAFQTFLLPRSMRDDLQRLGLGSVTQASDLISLVLGPKASNMSEPGIKGLFFDQSILANQGGGDLFSLLQQYSNPSFNELFFTVNDAGLPEVRYRERPFPCYAARGVETSGELGRIYRSVRQWEDLRGVAIPRRSFNSFSVTRSEKERINYWMLYADGTPLSHQDQMYLMGDSFLRGAPLVDTESVQRYGLRRYEASSLYTGYDVAGTGERWIVPSSYWLSQLYSWYRLNHRYLSGVGKLPYLERAEIGNRCWVNGIDGTTTEFYIEGVVWQWKKDNRGATHPTTELMLTRGIGGLVGEYSRGQHDDYFEWDAGSQYPLPLPPIDDVVSLLESAAQIQESWADPDKIRSRYYNEELESSDETHRTPDEWTGYERQDSILGVPEQSLPSTAALEAWPPPVGDHDPYTILQDVVAYQEGDTPTSDETKFVGPDGVEYVDTDDDGLTYENTSILVGLGIRTPQFIVLHTTERNLRERSGDTPQRRVNRWTDEWVERGSRLTDRGATHFLIMKEGYVVQFLPLRRRGAHAEKGGGNRGIGIDLEGFVADINPTQMDALLRLVEMEQLVGLPIIAHRHLDDHRSDPDRDRSTELITPWFEEFWWTMRFRSIPGAEDPNLRGLEWDIDGLLPTFEPTTPSGSLETATFLDHTLVERPLYDMTNSFIGDNSVTEVPDASVSQGNVDNYQGFLDANGIWFASARVLTYLRDGAAVEKLANDGVQGYFWNSDVDRTLFAVPPIGFWYNILPPLLVIQSVFEWEGRNAALDSSDWEIFDAYRPPEYNREVRGHPHSMHRYNHAIKLRLRQSSFEEIPGDEAYSWQGSAWESAFMFEACDGPRYGASVRFYNPLEGETINLERTHIDAGFITDTAPDGSSRDSTSTRPHGAERAMQVQSG